MPEDPIPFKPVTPPPTRAATPPPTPQPVRAAAPQPATSIPMPAQFAPASKPAAAAAPAGPVILTPLRSVSETWPEAVQLEIVQAGLGQSKIALPVDQVEGGLKRGRVVHPWKTIRAWISPAAPMTVSPHDATELELPLKVLAPLFMSHKQAGGATASKVAVDQAIPDLFHGGSKPQAPVVSTPPTAPAPVKVAPPTPAPAKVTPPAPAPVKAAPFTPASPIAMPTAPATTAKALSSAAAASNAAAAASAAAAATAASAAATAGLPISRGEDTNFYLWNDASETTLMHVNALKKTGSKGTEFVKRYSSPNEIVARAAAMDGVAGVLVALPDGLMVASQIPPEHNGDTLAAFLPQIFSKVHTCAKELRMGELNNVSFTVGTTPWKIWRVNAIFFAVFGSAAKPMPTAQLASLAAELDRKK